MNDQFLQDAGADANMNGSPDALGDTFNDDGFDPLAGTTSGRRAPTGVIILGGVIAAAAIGLWSMKFVAKASAGGQENSAAVQAVESWLSQAEAERHTSDDDQRRASSLAVLSGQYADRAIPLRDLQRNPFILFIERNSTGTDVPDDTNDIQRRFEARKQARMQAFELAATGLNLKMIAGGSNPLANINGTIVGIGDPIPAGPGSDIIFTVESIEGDVVTLRAVDDTLLINEEYTIEMERQR